MVFDPNCELCSLCKGATNVCLPGGMRADSNKSPKLMVVVDYPSTSEDSSGESFSDQPLLDKLLFEILEIPVEDIYFTYLAKCRPIGTLSSAANFVVCRDKYLMDEIKIVDPQCILLVGADVAECILKKPLKSLRGSVHEWMDRSVVATYSPNMGRKDPALLPSIAEDIQRAYNIVYGVSHDIKSTEIVEVDSEEILDKLIQYIKQIGGFSYDFETNMLDIFSPAFYPTSLSISFQPGCSYVIKLFHYDEDSPWINWSERRIRFILINKLSEVFLDREIWKVAHNHKFDGNIYAKYFGFHPLGVLYDTMTMHHQLYNHKKHGLKIIVPEYFPELKGYEDEAKRHKWSKIPWNDQRLYNGVDSDVTIRLKSILEGELLQNMPSYLAYRNLMSASIVPLMMAEYRGSLINMDNLREGISVAEHRMEELMDKMYSFPTVIEYNNRKRRSANLKALKELEEKITKGVNKGVEERYRVRINALRSGQEQVFDRVNFDSPLQLKDLLYGPDGFRFPIPTETRYNKEIELDNTGKDTLTMIDDTTGFIDILLNYRGVGKTLKTYLRGIEERVDMNSRVHGKFLQHGTATFRMSSADPNLQNIITRSPYEDVKHIITFVKGSFACPEDYTILNADFSQLELRLIAHIAQETTMLKAYEDEIDLHELTAANDHGYTLEEFRNLSKDKYKQFRYEAKARNFGLIYGQSAPGFKEYARAQYGIKISDRDAKLGRDKFFRKYPKLLTYHQVTVNRGKRDGFVTTIFGSRVHIPDIYSPIGAKRSHAERNAINSPVQGSGGQFGIFGIALLNVRLDPRVLLFNTVHDSIILYTPNFLVEETIPIVKETLENLPVNEYFGITFDKVKLKVDIEASTKSWKDLEPISNF